MVLLSILLADASTQDCEVSVVLPRLDEAESVGLQRKADFVMPPGSRGGGGGRQRPDRRLARAGCRRGANVVHEPMAWLRQRVSRGLRGRARRLLLADAATAASADLSEVPALRGRARRRGRPGDRLALRGRIEQLCRPTGVGNPLLTGHPQCVHSHPGVGRPLRDASLQAQPPATSRPPGDRHGAGVRAPDPAGLLGLDEREIPIDYLARIGELKLETFADGWRLRLPLVHSPTWPFLILGAILTVLGIVTGGLALSPAPDESRQLHGLIVAGLLAIVGCQVLQFGVFARSFAAWHHGRDCALLRACAAVDQASSRCWPARRSRLPGSSCLPRVASTSVRVASTVWRMRSSRWSG